MTGKMKTNGVAITRHGNSSSSGHRQSAGEKRSEMAPYSKAERKQAKSESNTKKSGSFAGKSNALGHGGRAAQLEAKGVPGGVIGNIARSKGAAPGGPNYHGGKKR